MIQTAVAMNDTSMLQPLNVKDAIWLGVESRLQQGEKAKYESEKFKYLDNRIDQIFMALQDLCYIDVNNNYLHKVTAFKGGKRMPKINWIDGRELPSTRFFAEKRKLEAREGKTDAELEQERMERERQEQEKHNALIRHLVKMGQSGERKADS